LAVLTKTLQPLLAGEDHSDRHDALILIRDHWGRPELATLVISALDKMFQRPAANWDQAASRTVACQILGKYADERAVPVLLKAMEDPFEQHFFDHNGPRGHVGHSYHTIWWEADAALRKITHASPSEAPATHRSPKPGQREKTLADWKAWVAARPAGKPLSQVKPPTDAEIDQAIKQLAGADRNARHKAAERLGEAGPAANRAIPALIAALKEEARRPKADSEMAATTEEGYAGCLIRVLAGFGKPAVASLIEVLKKDADLRLHLLDVLERIGADAEAAVPVVVSLGKDADDETRASAIGTLGKIGRRSPQAIAAVSDGLRDGFQPVRAKAVRALGECGPAAKEAVPALIRAWKEEKDESVRQGILDALGLIGPGAKDAVPMLTEALRHNEPIIRWCAARALGRIGPSAATATAALTEATSYKADYVRKQAAESLERISRTKASGGRAGAPPSAPAPPSPPQGLPSDMLQKDLLQHKMIEPGVKEFFERARHKFAQTPSRVAISPDTLKKPGAMGSGWKFDHDSEEGGHGRFLQFLGQGAMLKLSGGDELMVHLRTFPSAAQAREWALNRAFSGAAPTDSMLQRANRYFGKPEYPGDFCFGPWLFNRANVVVEYGSAMTDEAALRVSREVDKQILGLTPELTPRPAAEK
jgi:HEAT repeat protein